MYQPIRSRFGRNDGNVLKMNALSDLLEILKEQIVFGRCFT